ncbi:MAG: hypothetical protein QF464_01745, partial [Myxococcota bacterium]|nr:hypothetical protein [Myxococcota bacterium]
MLKHALMATMVVVLMTGCSDTPDGTDTDAAQDSGPSEHDGEPAEVDETSTPSDVGPAEDTLATPDTGEPPTGCPVVTDLTMPSQSGVAYVAHYHTSELRWYRTDGTHPLHAGTLDTAGFTHDMALNPVADLLAVAHDIGRSVELFHLDRPETPGGSLDPPALVATIDLGPDAPRRLTFDVARDRLYIVGNAPLTQGDLLESMLLYVYDTSDPAAPTALAEPQTIPVVTSFAVDPYAGVLGLIDLDTKELVLYDASSPVLVAHPGEPIDLRALYPQVNNAGFQPRNLRFDPPNGRILVAREQTAMSEVIALSYPSVLHSAEGCPAQPTYEDLVVIPDGFDVDQAPEDWDNLLGAHDAIPVANSEAVMFIGEAWNGQASTSIVIPLDGSLEPQAGCGDYAGSGCFYQGYVNDAPVSHKRTDGAACVDATHGV